MPMSALAEVLPLVIRQVSETSRPLNGRIMERVYDRLRFQLACQGNATKLTLVDDRVEGRLSPWSQAGAASKLLFNFLGSKSRFRS